MASMQYIVHSNDAEQQMHGQPLGHQYLPNDSMLFQHYADMDMAQSGGLRNLLQAETHGTPTANYGMDRGVAGKTPLHVLTLVCVCVYVSVCVCVFVCVLTSQAPCVSLNAEMAAGKECLLRLHNYTSLPLASFGATDVVSRKKLHIMCCICSRGKEEEYNALASQQV